MFGRLTRKDWVAVAVLTGLLLANALFLNYNAFRCFNFFDMSGFLDASWRIFKGQRPYIDFIYTTGPVHLYMNALFFGLFGFGKSALLAHLVVVSSLIGICVFVVLRKTVPVFIALAAAGLSMTAFYWPISHPWYDQSAHFFGVAGVLLFVWQRPVKGKGFSIGLICGALAIVAFMAKSNVGALYGAVFFITFLFSESHKNLLVGYTLGLTVMTGIMAFIIQSPGEYLTQAIFLFGRNKLGRLESLSMWSSWFINYYWIALGLVLVNAKAAWQNARDLLVLLVGVTLVGIVAAHSSNMLKSANVVLWGVQMALAWLLMYSIKGRRADTAFKIRWVVSTALLGLLTGALIVISAKYGFQLKAWSYYKPDPTGDYALKSKPLNGWLCERASGQPLDEMVEFFNANIPVSDSLLVLGDMQLLYALTGRDSYRGVPFIFQTGDLPVRGEQVTAVHNRILSAPPDWILWHLHDPTYGKTLLKYIGVWEDIQRLYTPVKVWSYYVLLRRNS